MKQPLILASKSPRRVELMQQIGLKFTVCPANIDESVADDLTPAEAVAQISRRKALEVSRQQPPEAIVIACDTVVACDGRIFGKPNGTDEADAMLHTLSGRTHCVYSGLTVCRDTEAVTTTECTEVTFRALSDAEIEAYVRSGEPMDKAGAYGIQGLGAVLVETIHGDYYNVVGLPLCQLTQMLRTFGVELLQTTEC